MMSWGVPLALPVHLVRPIAAGRTFGEVARNPSIQEGQRRRLTEHVADRRIQTQPAFRVRIAARQTAPE
jgi:hypothetical protein